ncbi:MAG: phage major capsid protein [Rhizobiales bacterium]|nr:phage major capsid protein [Hyphomicrobiales bacterium]MBI3672366.1 phage major capsid protein [Hyphomicrobiales bacterium]
MDTGLETKVAFGDFMQAFEAFKDANDERLAQIEKRMGEDVVTADKVERINRAVDQTKARLDELTLKARRPQLSGEGAASQGPSEHKQAFETYVRKGETQGLFDIEAKSMSVGSGTDGGYLVPSETETEIGRRLSAASPIRAISGVRQVSTSVYKKPFAITGAVTGWVGETAARTETAAPTLAELQFPAMELYAMPAATQSLLDDAAVNLDQWIADEVQQAFADQESTAFVTGNGTNKPKGFLAYTNVADASWTWGNLGYVATGVAGAFAASNPSDKLIDLIYTLKNGYRQNAVWITNRKTQGVIRKFKDASGDYLWQPAATPDGKATLMNFPVVESEDVPDIATDSFSLAFGDFGRGYLVVDRIGVRVLRDPYSSKPYVLFYTTKRVGGGVQNFEAIKLMKFGVS